MKDIDYVIRVDGVPQFVARFDILTWPVVIKRRVAQDCKGQFFRIERLDIYHVLPADLPLRIYR